MVILLVEDDSSLLEVVRNILEWQGYHVLTARSFEQAKDQEATFPGEINLLVTDFGLQSGNGLEVARYVRARRPHVTVIFMSGQAPESILDPDDFQPGDSFISKPFRLASLVNKVKALLNGSEVET